MKYECDVCFFEDDFMLEELEATERTPICEKGEEL